MSELRVIVPSVGTAEHEPELAALTGSSSFGREFEVPYSDDEPLTLTSRVAKRCLDLVIAIPSLILLFPLLVILAIIIRIESKGSPVYCSSRMGKHNVPFTCYKLRTMVSNADLLKEKIRHLNYRTGATFKVEGDPRVTSIGRFLRKFSLDELPQLWNVVMGDMSIVGPRPHPIDDIALYSSADLRRHRVKPGLTGLWQVSARKDPSFRRNMKLDNLYISTWTFQADLTIILRTFSAVIRGDGE
jgi:lipopolysaccharide/colanic/teichoic acid biosynthesis glycosyltransferase